MSFYDKYTNIVYIAEALKRHGKFYGELVNQLVARSIEVKLIKGTKNIWVRDYMPIQVNNHFVKFHYHWGESRVHKFPSLIVCPNCIDMTYKVSDIGLDGGNCIRYGDKAIITDIIYKHNPWYKRNKLISDLEELLEAQVIVIPKEPYDDLGHADGIVKWIDEKTLFVANFDNKKYLEKVVKVLAKHGLEGVLFPHAYAKCPKMTEQQFRKEHPQADEWGPGFGYYINLLEVKNLILCPQFGIAEDEIAVDMLRKHFPDSSVKGIECGYLSMEGGLLSCTTANYRVN